MGGGPDCLSGRGDPCRRRLVRAPCRLRPPQGEDGVSPSLKYRMVVFFSSVSLNSIS